MSRISKGVTVKVHYTGKYTSGEVFDSTAAREPIIFTIGDEMMIPGFEKEVCSMEKGETRTVLIPSDDAYGDYDPDLMIEVSKQDIFDDKEIHLGDQVQIPVENNVLVLTVKEIKDETVVLDGNSELVGKDLIFEIELLDILDGSEDTDSYLEGDFDDEFGGGFDDEFNDEYSDDLMYGPE